MRRKRTSRPRGIYKHWDAFWFTLPDRLYPFACTVNGKRVRGKRAYDYMLARARARLGDGHYGATLFMYREACHFIGAVLFITLSTYLSQRFFGSDVAMRVLFVTAVLVISVQEFYLHPRHHGQRFVKSIVDWTAWVLPMSAYIVLFAR